MKTEMHIKGSLANLPGEAVSEAAFLAELERRGLSSQDAQLELEKAILEAWVARAPDGQLQKLIRARTEAVLGNLANP
jgi:hypothetical protein